MLIQAVNKLFLIADSGWEFSSIGLPTSLELGHVEFKSSEVTLEIVSSGDSQHDRDREHSS